MPSDEFLKNDAFLTTELLKLAVESAGIGIWKVEPATRTVEATAALKQMLNIPLDRPIDYAAFIAALHPDDRAQARVDLVRYRLARAEMRAPFAGVVVEGDLREKIGAPVKTGDILLKVSQLKGLYVEMRVPERDVDLIQHSEVADVAFASRPEDTFKVKVERIEPSALPDREGNFFIVRGQLDQRAEWFRPGMSGVAKIEAGHRSLLWMATHRLIDFLRLKLWW